MAVLKIPQRTLIMELWSLSLSTKSKLETHSHKHILISNFLNKKLKQRASKRGLHWEENWVLDYNYIKFWDFSDLSWFPKIIRLKSFGNLWGNSYNTMFIVNGVCFACGETKTWKASKSLKILWKWL